jgi:hypothetical protein
MYHLPILAYTFRRELYLHADLSKCGYTDTRKSSRGQTGVRIQSHIETMPRGSLLTEGASHPSECHMLEQYPYTP